VALMANVPPFDPPPPGPINIRTFQALRTFLIDYVVNSWMQYVINYERNQVLPVLNTAAWNYGNDIASAATISPSALVQLITGSAAISTINAPGNMAGAFYAIARDGFSTTTAGNILLAVTVPANHTANFVYHPVLQKWGVITS
jgi:hypothetical protein